jgi:hypothetical protein
MKTYKGKVEIFNDSGRVHYPIETTAGSWPVAAYRFVVQAIKIYREARKGTRVKIKSIVVDITEITV